MIYALRKAKVFVFQWYICYVCQTILPDFLRMRNFKILNIFTSIFLLFVFPVLLFAQNTEFKMPFSDVPANAYFYSPVRTALQRNVISEGESFNPGASLTRAEYTEWIVYALAVPDVGYSATPSFTDVPKTFPQYDAIETAKKLGIVAGMYDKNGNPTGEFKPNKSLNRAEAAVILMRSFQNFAAVTDGSVSFPDLDGVAWARVEILKSAKAKFFKGYPDGTFGPGNNIKRAEGITLVSRVIEEIQNGSIVPEYPIDALRAPVNTAENITVDTAAIVNRISETLPGSEYHNLSVKGGKAVFFASTDDGYGWYTLDPTDPAAWPVKVAESSRWNLIYRAAVSPDGKELITLSQTGEIIATDLTTNVKSTIGVFTEQLGGAEQPKYSSVAYTPDGKYILLHNLWNSTLLVFDAHTKDVANGTVIAGFSISGSGGGETTSGTDITLFEFSDDGKRMTFEKKYVLNLETLTKEE